MARLNRFRVPQLPPIALLLELVGMAAVLTGIGLIYVPAALIVGGLAAIYVAIGLNNDAPDE